MIYIDESGNEGKNVTEVRPREPALESSARVKQSLVSLLRPTSFEAEQFRTLRYIVEQLHKDANLQVVAVSSPGAGDGKTTTAINLAGALAQAPDARVLLVDADLRQPSVSKYLGIDDSRSLGLVDAILKPGLQLEDIEWGLPPFNLSALPVGQPPAAPYE